MAREPLSGITNEVSVEKLTNAGERMVVGNMWGYWAHLSIYHFALKFAEGRRVLDAGSGAGYGSAYLARHGAKVLAFDAGAVAIEHSRRRYAGDSVTFEIADLNAPLGLGDGVFDLVFSSNVFEHVGNVDGLAAECARVMAPGGVTIVAVPPICSAAAVAADMENQFHVHHIPPTAWHSKLLRFFENVRCHAHVGRGVFADKAREQAEMRLPSDQVTIRETDFDFPQTTPEAMLQANNSITAVFVCRGRRLPIGPEALAERMPAEWRDGEIAAQLIGNLKAELSAANANSPMPPPAPVLDTEIYEKKIRDAHVQAQVEAAKAFAAQQQVAALMASKQELEERVASLESSTIWRVTAPMRSLVDTV